MIGTGPEPRPIFYSVFSVRWMISSWTALVSRVK